MLNILFILPNIYESINGVSNKYIKFIEYLQKSNKCKITLFIPFIDSQKIKHLENKNIKIINVNGIQLLFYEDIKIPLLNEDEILNEMEETNNIIIFNGEFAWLYSVLEKVKEKNNEIKIYPTWHTDYENYAEYFNPFSFIPIFDFKYPIKKITKYLNYYLENKIFYGLITTGEHIKNRFIKNTKIFNAAELNLNIYNKLKIDTYDLEDHSPLNIIYCGRISKEKNIEELFECLLKLINKYNFIMHIIGDGPDLDKIKKNINNTYHEYYILKNNVIFYGSKSSNEIVEIYKKLDNRIFLFTSITETFGKSPMEACSTGIILFIKKSEASISLYQNKKTAFIFNDPEDFLKLFNSFMLMTYEQKKEIIESNRENIEKYNQDIIFEEWLYFLLEEKTIENKTKFHIFDRLFLNSFKKLIMCTENLSDE
jgi:glycosyltransferase involved in cell wall biosynthesis